MILGGDDPIMKGRLEDLVELGYWPIEIHAVPEGTVLPVKNVLATFENTHVDFAWVVGFLESLFLKVWNTCSVATMSRQFRKSSEKYADLTCDNHDHVMFQTHDFGYRGASTEETAAFSGMAHLVNSYGTDTIVAVKAARDHYDATQPIGLSVPATEHSVMCSYGIEHEYDAFLHIMKKYPTGFLSIVSDTYDYWNIMTDFITRHKEDILARDGRVVFRPDSGDPELIICGDPMAEIDTPEYKGSIRLLDEVFGSTLNSKGFKVLNPKVGLIYGEGITLERQGRILQRLMEQGYASSNVVFGIGGLLLQRHNRDDGGFAIKALYAEVGIEPRNLVKTPKTDVRKASHAGPQKLILENGAYRTVPMDDFNDRGELRRVFNDGTLHRQTFDEIRKRAA